MCYHASPQPMVTSCFLNSITEIRRVVWIKAYLRGACLIVSSLHSMIITFTLLTFKFGSFIIIAPKHVKYMCVHPLYPVCQGRNPVPSCTLEVKARQYSSRCSGQQGPQSLLPPVHGGPCYQLVSVSQAMGSDCQALGWWSESADPMWEQEGRLLEVNRTAFIGCISLPKWLFGCWSAIRGESRKSL